jgi:hypothetical protein
MMSHKQFHFSIGGLTLAVAGLGALNWHFRPEAALNGIIGIAAMPVIWFVVAYILKKRSRNKHTDDERRFFTRFVMAAGLILAGSQSIKLFEILGDHDIAVLDRIWGVTLGIILIVIGNRVPKILSPLTAKRCGPSTATSVQRFAGWALVLAGAGWTIAWIALPIGLADRVAMTFGMTGLGLVLLRYIFTFGRPGGASPPPG